MSKIRMTLRPVEAADEWILRVLSAESLRPKLRAEGLAPREIELLVEMQFRDSAARQRARDGCWACA